MTPMATLATARLAGRRTPGRLVLLDHPLFKFGPLAMGVGELFGDKMKSAPDRTVFLGLLARVMSAGVAGAALRRAVAKGLGLRSRSPRLFPWPISPWPAVSARLRALGRPAAVWSRMRWWLAPGSRLWPSRWADADGTLARRSRAA